MVARVEERCGLCVAEPGPEGLLPRPARPLVLPRAGRLLPFRLCSLLLFCVLRSLRTFSLASALRCFILRCLCGIGCSAVLCPLRCLLAPCRPCQICLSLRGRRRVRRNACLLVRCRRIERRAVVLRRHRRVRPGPSRLRPARLPPRARRRSPPRRQRGALLLRPAGRLQRQAPAPDLEPVRVDDKCNLSQRHAAGDRRRLVRDLLPPGQRGWRRRRPRRRGTPRRALTRRLTRALRPHGGRERGAPRRRAECARAHPQRPGDLRRDRVDVHLRLVRQDVRPARRQHVRVGVHRHLRGDERIHILIHILVRVGGGPCQALGHAHGPRHLGKLEAPRVLEHLLLRVLRLLLAGGLVRFFIGRARQVLQRQYRLDFADGRRQLALGGAVQPHPWRGVLALARWHHPDVVAPFCGDAAPFCGRLRLDLQPAERCRPADERAPTKPAGSERRLC